MKNSDVLNDVFLFENGSEQSLSNSFIYDRYIFDKYEIRLIDNVLYALPCNPQKYIDGRRTSLSTNDDLYCLNDIVTPIDCKTGDLLFSLLRLKDNIKTYSFSDRIEEKDIAAIIAWCKRYGFPFEGCPRNIAATDEHRNDLWDNNKILGFSVWSFILLLDGLNNAFLQYQIMTGVHNAGNRINDLPESEQKEYAKSCLESVFSSLRLSVKITDTNGLRVMMKADNLFIAALYQLLLYLNNPTGNNIRMCENCGAYFYATRKNQKYCGSVMPNGCKPQNAYKRRMKKEVTIDGEH